MRLSKIFVALATGLVAASPALTAEFATAKDDLGNSVTFNISAPLETIVGASAGVSGHYKFDPNNVKEATSELICVMNTSATIFSRPVTIRRQRSNWRRSSRLLHQR
jgi:hypothetical protein